MRMNIKITKYFSVIIAMSLVMVSLLIVSCQSEAKLSRSEAAVTAGPADNKLTPARSTETNLQVKVRVEILGQSRLSNQIKSAIWQQSEIFRGCWQAPEPLESVQLTGNFLLLKSGEVSQFKILEMAIGNEAFKECFSSHFSKLNFSEVLSGAAKKIAPAKDEKTQHYNVSFTWSLFRHHQH